MTAIQSVTGSGAAGNTLAASLPSTTSGADIQDRFLKLLVTQLKNQDPLNPLDNAQITSQLSQISTVTGIDKLNTTLQGLSTSMLSSQSLQSAALIGHTVYSDGSTLTLAGGAPASGGFQLSGTADSVKVNVLGPSGNVVRQLDIGPRVAGFGTFQWDGLNDGGASVAAGQYTFQVEAKSGTQKVVASPLMAGTVTGVTPGSNGLQVSVGGRGDLSLDQIKRIM